MLKLGKIGMLSAILVILLLSFNSAQAIVISFDATDLADTTSGEDLWQYTYTVSDHTFAADTGFTIYFDIGLYSNIEDPAPYVNDHWDILTFQPDANAWPADGMYDAYALADSASLADPFTVSFVWSGTGAPGAQFFEVYDGLTWEVLDSGQAVAAASAPVPEPATMLLLGTGLVGLAGFRNKFKPTKANS